MRTGQLLGEVAGFRQSKRSPRGALVRGSARCASDRLFDDVSLSVVALAGCAAAQNLERAHFTHA
jgi:hypothetical protein